MTPRITNAVLAVKMDSMDESINNRIDLLADTVEKHETLLYGNGDEGLKETTNSNKKTLGEVKWWVRLAGGAVILEGLNRIFDLF